MRYLTLSHSSFSKSSKNLFLGIRRFLFSFMLFSFSFTLISYDKTQSESKSIAEGSWESLRNVFSFSDFNIHFHFSYTWFCRSSRRSSTMLCWYNVRSGQYFSWAMILIIVSISEFNSSPSSYPSWVFYRSSIVNSSLYLEPLSF